MKSSYSEGFYDSSQKPPAIEKPPVIGIPTVRTSMNACSIIGVIRTPLVQILKAVLNVFVSLVSTVTGKHVKLGIAQTICVILTKNVFHQRHLTAVASLALN